ncbi:hypothetical protein [Flavobacterium sp.]|uniref:hypothetical protein n=1 Tax=Flavobacterium sp. TaxID=239 RepID=UPI0031D877F9
MNKLILIFGFFIFSAFGLAQNKKIKKNNIVSVLDFGAVGDGVTDNSEAFQKAILYCINNKKTLYIPKTKSSYNIYKTIRIALSKNDKIKIISNQAVIMPGNLENSTAYNLTSFREHIFLSVGRKINSIKKFENEDENVGTGINISGLIFDGKKEKYPEQILSFDNDIYIGAQLIAEKVNVTDCIFRNIFGYGLRIHEVSNSVIQRCKFINVGGRGATPFANKIDVDGLGDAIYHAKVNPNANVLIKDCQITGMKYNNKRSRCGITFEYSTVPYKVNLEKLNISGYAKCLHIEETATGIFHIENVTMKDFNFGIANVLNDQGEIYLNNCSMQVGFNDGNDNGDALAFLNYRSKAKIYVNKSVLDFNGRKYAYQSIVGLKRVENSTINGNNTNLFFADGSTTFSFCKFINFGGDKTSFTSNNSNDQYTIENCEFSGINISTLKSTSKLNIKNSK